LINIDDTIGPTYLM